MSNLIYLLTIYFNLCRIYFINMYIEYSMFFDHQFYTVGNRNFRITFKWNKYKVFISLILLFELIKVQNIKTIISINTKNTHRINVHYRTEIKTNAILLIVREI